jgi:homocitrate synthase NifV
MKPVKHIVDTTMRDGEQSPGIAMSKEQKLKIASILDSAGIYQIEAGIPVVNSYEIETISAIVDAVKTAKISVWNRLILGDIEKSILCRPDIIHISAPVSYVLIYSKLNKNKAWVVKNLMSCVEYASSRGYDVTVGFEDASRADITFMAALARQLKELGVSRIRFADTVGVLSPARTYEAVKEIIDYAGIGVEMHAHNDLGMAVANTVMGAKAGADFLDTTICGLGERAGNCDFFKLIHAAYKLFDMGVTQFQAVAIQNEIADILSIG